MSHRSGVLFLTVSLAAVLASACGEDGDDGGGAGADAGGSAGTSAGTGGKGGSSGASGASGGSGGTATGGSSGKGGASGTGGAGGAAGKGGAGGLGGKAGSSGAAGKGGSGGTAGAPECEIVQCIRPIDCVETCGGPVLKSSCCPCDEGTFDNFECDGSGGSGARRGSGGEPNEPSNAGAGGGFDLSDLNSDCVDDECPEGLTPIHYYGIAGPGGPEFCSCSIPCDEGPSACPDGTECVNVSDGPGNVCWVP